VAGFSPTYSPLKSIVLSYKCESPRKRKSRC
jgi:hypothetical protein